MKSSGKPISSKARFERHTMASAAPLQASVCLPRVPGPKLVSFTPDGYADIKFLQRLSEHNAKDGYVWKVEIHGSVYALKIVRVNQYYLREKISLIELLSVPVQLHQLEMAERLAGRGSQLPSCPQAVLLRLL